MCEKEELRKNIETAKAAIKKARTQADELQKSLCDSRWIAKYKGDATVILTYSQTVRNLRNESRELEAAVTFLENRLEIENIKNLFDDKVIEKLKKLNSIVEGHIEATLKKN